MDHVCLVVVSPLCTSHVIDVVEDILLNSSNMFHAGDRAIETATCKDHVEPMFGDNAVDVSRRWLQHHRTFLLAASADEGSVAGTNSKFTLFHKQGDQAS